MCYHKSMNEKLSDSKRIIELLHKAEKQKERRKKSYKEDKEIEISQAIEALRGLTVSLTDGIDQGAFVSDADEFGTPHSILGESSDDYNRRLLRKCLRFGLSTYGIAERMFKSDPRSDYKSDREKDEYVSQLSIIFKGILSSSKKRK